MKIGIGIITVIAVVNCLVSEGSLAMQGERVRPLVELATDAMHPQAVEADKATQEAMEARNKSDKLERLLNGHEGTARGNPTLKNKNRVARTKSDLITAHIDAIAAHKKAEEKHNKAQVEQNDSELPTHLRENDDIGHPVGYHTTMENRHKIMKSQHEERIMKLMGEPFSRD